MKRSCILTDQILNSRILLPNSHQNIRNESSTQYYIWKRDFAKDTKNSKHFKIQKLQTKTQQHISSHFKAHSYSPRKVKEKELFRPLQFKNEDNKDDESIGIDLVGKIDKSNRFTKR